ncbi:alpha/beta fold hydrolase [Microbacterium sp. RU33B]|uniref:alpha/beta fold hydrolase n=1 Tax=Microbacterium sp. RU33B TaxID=1907390 RepID=UPI000969D400|nr:alpha/beta hydrolase [Microbacterium sp. RU33B]SIT89450.1 Lysophospholipase, alpha-beta hydrolase superfamily [Microbacterium sp. RU33B]
MQHTVSADGTRIAYDAMGDGPTIVVVNGAMSQARDARPLAEALRDAGFRAVTFDRRARGGSGDARGSEPVREAEDLAAVIEAVGGAAAVIGHSSGAVLALFAASLGVPVTRLFLSEPPFHFGEDEPADDLPERLQALVDDGRGGDAITTFQLEAIGLPVAMVEQIRSSPMFADLVPLAQSTVYDATLTRQLSTPTIAMADVEAPVTILCGVDTFPMLTSAAQRLDEIMPDAELIEVPESVQHRLDPAATVRIIAVRVPAE